MELSAAGIQREEGVNNLGKLPMKGHHCFGVPPTNTRCSRRPSFTNKGVRATAPRAGLCKCPSWLKPFHNFLSFLFSFSFPSFYLPFLLLFLFPSSLLPPSFRVPCWPWPSILLPPPSAEMTDMCHTPVLLLVLTKVTRRQKHDGNRVCVVAISFLT